MRVYLLIANDGAVLVIDRDAPAYDCDDCAEPMIVEIVPAEPRDTIPSPPPEFEPDAAELFDAIGVLAWHRAPVGRA